MCVEIVLMDMVMFEMVIMVVVLGVVIVVMGMTVVMLMVEVGLYGCSCSWWCWWSFCELRG